jgi:hypothetical protein
LPLGHCDRETTAADEHDATDPGTLTVGDEIRQCRVTIHLHINVVLPSGGNRLDRGNGPITRLES